MSIKKELDLLGMVCPYPLLKTEKEFVNLGNQEVLIIRLDNNQSVRNILDWCEKRGAQFEIEELERGIWELKIIKK